jgi:hypothetical protein
MPTTSASVARRLVFRDLLRCWGGKQAALAFGTGMSPALVSKILSGDREITWDQVHAAIDATTGAFPESAPDVARSLALNVAGVVVEPVFLGADPVGDYRDELDDVDLAQGDLLRAVRANDRAAAVEAARVLVQQADEAARAARLHVAG